MLSLLSSLFTLALGEYNMDSLSILMQTAPKSSSSPGLSSELQAWGSLMCKPISQFSRSVVSDSLRPQGLQHARPPCPSPTLGAYSNSCPLSW